jgi:hypothetical protein
MERPRAGLSLGHKFAAVWLLWFALVGTYCCLSVLALLSATNHANEIYRDRLKPSQDLSTAASSLAALQALLENVARSRGGAQLTHGYIPLLGARVNASMAQFWPAFQDTRDHPSRTFRTAAVRAPGIPLTSLEQNALDE